MAEWLTWREAMDRALYGPAGFFRAMAPAAHFRTSAHASPLFAGALLRLAERVDAALGRPDGFTVVDIGAGRGELLAELARAAPARWRLTAVELAERPSGLIERIDWRETLPRHVTGLLLANEWLDNVPCDVVERSPDGTRLVEVDPTTGAERLADTPDDAALSWLARWWPPSADEPITGSPERVEVGSRRDDAWSDAMAGLTRGAGVAIDYAHLADARPRGGTLTGYRAGRQVTPAPDGSCDLTAHVAMDACAAAGREAGAESTVLVSQRDALRALGVSGARPPIELAHADPRAYLRALSAAAAAAELTDPAGLGAFLWLTQTRGIPPPLV